MAFFSTIRATERSPVRPDPAIEHPGSLQAAHIANGAAVSLPHHLPVSLAGMTTDHLVGSRHERSAHPTAPGTHRAGLTTASPSGVFAGISVDLAEPDGVARPHNGVARPLRVRPSENVTIDDGRRKSWESASEHSS
jgi:hypothetical protein